MSTLYAFQVVYIQGDNGGFDYKEGTKLQCFVLAKDMWEAVEEAVDRVPNVQQIRIVHPGEEGIPHYCVNEKSGDVCSSEAWTVEKAIQIIENGGWSSAKKMPPTHEELLELQSIIKEMGIETLLCILNAKLDRGEEARK